MTQLVERVVKIPGKYDATIVRTIMMNKVLRTVPEIKDGDIICDENGPLYVYFSFDFQKMHFDKPDKGQCFLLDEKFFSEHTCVFTVFTFAYWHKYCTEYITFTYEFLKDSLTLVNTVSRNGTIYHYFDTKQCAYLLHIAPNLNNLKYDVLYLQTYTYVTGHKFDFAPDATYPVLLTNTSREYLVKINELF